MRKLILVPLLALLVSSISGCFWGPPPGGRDRGGYDRDRGGYDRDRGDRGGPGGDRGGPGGDRGGYDRR